MALETGMVAWHMQHHARKFESMTVTAQYTVAMQLATWDKSEMRDWNVARWLAAFLSLLKQVVWQTYAVHPLSVLKSKPGRTNLKNIALSRTLARLTGLIILLECTEACKSAVQTQHDKLSIVASAQLLKVQRSSIISRHSACQP